MEVCAISVKSKYLPILFKHSAVYKTLDYSCPFSSKPPPFFFTKAVTFTLAPPSEKMLHDLDAADIPSTVSKHDSELHENDNTGSSPVYFICGDTNLDSSCSFVQHLVKSFVLSTQNDVGTKLHYWATTKLIQVTTVMPTLAIS
jgi:hypothetical protein